MGCFCSHLIHDHIKKALSKHQQASKTVPQTRLKLEFEHAELPHSDIKIDINWHLTAH